MFSVSGDNQKRGGRKQSPALEQAKQSQFALFLISILVQRYVYRILCYWVIIFPLQVTCSYLQIYQERVYDLLGAEKSGPEVYLREHPKKGRVNEKLSLHIYSRSDPFGAWGMIWFCVSSVWTWSKWTQTPLKKPEFVMYETSSVSTSCHS